jgi:hypothetical protein
MSAAPSGLLEAATAEIEAHVAGSGWDRRPTLFALVRSAQLAADDPETAARLGLADAVGDGLTPIEQDEVPKGPLDEVLAQLGWPDAVVGCALSQEILILPPSAEPDLPDDTGDLTAVANHPERREARLVVAVLRGGDAAAMLRLRGRDGAPDGELLTGADLAPNLVDALLATFDED